MQTSISTLSSFTTDSLVCLAVPLDGVQAGIITPGTSEYLELVDTDLLAAVREALQLTDDGELVTAIQGELAARHPAIAAVMQAWELSAHLETSWSTALLEGADAVREQEHERLDRLGAVTAFTYFMNP